VIKHKSNKGKRAKDVMKAAAVCWKKMTQAERDKYKAQYCAKCKDCRSCKPKRKDKKGGSGPGGAGSGGKKC